MGALVLWPTRRPKRPLKGKDKIGLRAGKALNSHKVGKIPLLERLRAH
jgi:hypothetical protein